MTSRATPPRALSAVHKCCAYIKRHDAMRADDIALEMECRRCPSWEQSGHYGKVKRGCRAQAEEMVNVVKFGNPWGRKYQRSRRFWPLRGWRDMK